MSPEEMERILNLAERIEQEERMDNDEIELLNKPTNKTIH